MKNKVKDKVVLITGASSGIGAAAALALNGAGAHLAITARRIDTLRKLAVRMQDPLVIPADISLEDDARRIVQEVVERFGRIDVLINNAALMIVAPSENVTREDLLMAFKTNLLGPVSATQEAIIQMKKQGGGQIINVGSPGFMMGIPYYSPYVCAKAAFCAWTRTIQAEWKDTGIVVCEYFPGYVLTDSRPESRIGKVEQDFLMSPGQNWLARRFTRPQTPETVADQIVNLIRHPRTLVFSGCSVQTGAWMSNFSGFRLRIASEMARTARNKMKQL